MREEAIAKVEAKLTELIGYEAHITRNANPAFSFRKGGTEFLNGQLSDGEKQILTLSPLALRIDDRKIVFLIDEPELHLHEARAVQFWETMENCFPNAIFLYATHSLPFATRPTVNQLYLMDMNGAIKKFADDLPIPQSIVQEIVGTRIQVLRTNKPIVFCEDNMLKFVLEDLLSKDRVEVISVGGCQNVVSAAHGDIGWDQVASAATRFCGVIDRDTRNENDIQRKEMTGVFCFPLYEAESLLLCPEIAAWVLSDGVGDSFSRDAYISTLVECARSARRDTLNRIKSYLCRGHPLEIDFDPGEDGLLSLSLRPAPDLLSLFKGKADELYSAIANNDVEAILRLFGGTNLYAGLKSRSVRRYGIKLPTAISQYSKLRAIPEFRSAVLNLPWIAAWTQKLERHLFDVGLA